MALDLGQDSGYNQGVSKFRLCFIFSWSQVWASRFHSVNRLGLTGLRQTGSNVTTATVSTKPYTFFLARSCWSQRKSTEESRSFSESMREYLRWELGKVKTGDSGDMVTSVLPKNIVPPESLLSSCRTKGHSIALAFTDLLDLSKGSYLLFFICRARRHHRRSMRIQGLITVQSE